MDSYYILVDLTLKDRLEDVELELGIPLYCVPSHQQSNHPGELTLVMHAVPVGTDDVGYADGEVGDLYVPDRYVPRTTPADGIYVGEDQILVGEIRPKVVFDYIGLWRYDNVGDEIRDAFCWALRKAVDPAFLAETAEREQAALRETLTNYVLSQYDRQVLDKRQEIDGLVLAIASTNNANANRVRQLREKQAILDAVLLVRRNDGAEKLLRDWDLLSQHPRVASLNFTNNSLIITTTDDLRITRPDTNESRWLGAFTITINIESLEIKLRNLNTRRGGRDHPHVTDGEPCFGGHDTSFYELLGRGELYVIFEHTLAYLETLNLYDEYGSYGSWWFDQPDERPLEPPYHFAEEATA